MPVDGAVMGKLAVAAMPWMKDALKAWYSKRASAKASERTWTEVANAVVRHTKVLAERFCEISTVAFPQETTQLDKIYVPLKLQERNRPSHHEIDAFPSSLLAKVRKLLVVDAAGMGKSTISRVIFLRALGERKALPIFVDLRRLTSNTRIDDVLAAQFALKKKHEEQFFDFLRTQPILFIFDGFDEVAEGEKVHVARMIRDFVDQNEKANFFITSRPEIYFSSFTDFKRYSIKPLAKSEAHALITKYGAAYEIEDRAKALLEELRAKHDPAVSSFLENPLLTSLLFRAFEYKSVVPVKRGVFYRQVFDALYDAHDLNKETGFVRTKRTGLHQDDFHRVLRAMASMFRRRKVSEVTQDVFKEMAREVTATVCSDLSFTPEDLVHDCTSSVPLFARDGNHIRWSHKSLLDYFLSEFLTRDYTESKIDALRKVAFAHQGIADQNFLTLVHESDPTLFTEAVTIPAGEYCLSRYDAIKSNLGKVDESDREDIAHTYMAYEFFYAARLPHSWEILSSRLEKNGNFDPSGYTLKFISPVQKKGYLIIFESIHFAALGISLRSGALRSARLRHVTIPKGQAPIVSDYEAINEKALFGTAFAKNDFTNIDQDFRIAISSMLSSVMNFPEAIDVKEILSELRKTVGSSKRARSNNIF